MKVLLKKRKLVATCALLGLVIGLCGCANSSLLNSDVSCIKLDKKGAVTSLIVEDFSKDYYDFDELKEEISDTVTAYNSAKGVTLVTFDDATKKDSNVRVTMTYEDADTYSDFNDVIFFYGTYEEMTSAGYELPDTLTNSDGESIDKSIITSDMNVIVTSEKISIITPYKIAYYSKGAVIDGNYKIDLSESSDEYSFIIMNAK